MKIVHLADLHLGYRAYNRLDENGYNQREIDVINAFRESLRKIVEIQPDLIIIAGDVFHRPRPSNLTIYQTISRLIAFRKKCSAPIIIVSGNHESVKAAESGNVLNILETVIPNVAVIDGTIKELEIKELDTFFAGIPYNALPELKNRTIAPDKNFKNNILCVHGSYDSVKCKELSKHGNGELITSADINQTEWDYVAFGHYHTFTELAPNAYYSGAIERTSSNIWQEADDKKGFIVYDFETKECKHIGLDSPRKVVDIKRIDAKELTAAEIDRKIDEEISKINDIENSIIRVTIENIDPVAVRELDYKKIRELKKKAVHFRLNLIKRDFSAEKDKDGQPIGRTKGLFEYLDQELQEFELSQGLDKDKFNKLAKDYLLAVNDV